VSGHNDTDTSILTIEGCVGRRVTEQVLLAKLRSDPCANARKIIERIYGKVPSAGLAGEFC